MRIKVINPNTTQAMTDNIGRVADRYTADSTEVVAVSPERGPASIESYYDDYLAVPGLLEEILREEKGVEAKEGDDAFDAYVVACWGDPGIEACREVTEKPVVGIAEASMYVANMLGARFSVATILPRAKDFIEAAVVKTGLESKCASVRCTDLTVIETEEAREATVEGLLEVSRLAVEEDGAEAICLGCAGMGGLDKALEAELPVPVVDSVGAGAVLAESLVSLGKSTSKVMTHKRPESKEMSGYPSLFEFTE
ncbi:aspartate/glutamate racemase family protein [Halobium salinum]|uniref:Aspartate/glutamate racemase family protein n=1 Tax=Halobium salinum TaxID=1364940 RepID=A0ABD5PJF6_9EURY|nr:aspartate/glutamate racemase family protein [Halobium salinum]